MTMNLTIISTTFCIIYIITMAGIATTIGHWLITLVVAVVVAVVEEAVIVIEGEGH